MNSFTLRLIAIITMAIDHIGAVLMKDSSYNICFRLIGRLSFPIFCFLIVEGVFHTRNIWKYAGRMLLFAFISEIPYDLAFHDTLFYWKAQNVFWTLFLGVVLMGICVYVPIIKDEIVLQIILAAAIAYLAYNVQCDYDAKGILLIFILGVLRKFGPYIQGIANGAYMYLLTQNTQKFAGFSGILIAFYNGKPGPRKLKYFFYLFYPLHLLIIYYIFKI